MLDTIALLGLVLAIAALWTMNWSLMQNLQQLRRQNLDLRKRLITVENYIFGLNRDDEEVWGDYNEQK